MRLQKYLNRINVTRKTLRRKYCQYSRIFPNFFLKISENLGKIGKIWEKSGKFEKSGKIWE
jgi:hypothetical protein